ncbi:MAG: hypothetical protein SVS15_03095 [Thermodesulfobacteriota bacterium]|nr:hypothetical protein [Thermodesulfobacteriota bacterium]
MEQFKLQRFDRPDLSFTGKMLAVVDEREFTGFLENWLEVSLYKTSMGKYVLSSNFHVTSCGNRNIHTTLAFDSLEHLLEYLEIKDRPLSCITGELLRQASMEDQAFDFFAYGTPPLEVRSAA